MPYLTIEQALARELRGDVRADDYTRHLYAGDASLYATAPLLVAFPRDADDVAAAIRAALRADLAGGPPTGFRPRDVHGDPRFLHTMASVIAAGTLLPGA